MVGTSIKVKYAGGYYHNSWDWLMPVIEKLESLGYRITLVKNQYTIEKYLEESDTYTTVLYQHGYFNRPKIDAVYLAAVETIKHYNHDNRKYV